MFGRSRGGSDWKTDPDARALLLVQQYLFERGGAGGALAALERVSGVRFDESKARAGALMALVYEQLQREAAERAGEEQGGSEDSDDEARAQLLRMATAATAGGGGGGIGSNCLATRKGGVASSAHGGSNVLCVKVLPQRSEKDDDEDDNQPLLVASGAADGTVRLFRFPNGPASASSASPPELIWETTPSTSGGGLLSIDAIAVSSTTCYLACTSMDGGVAVLDASTGALLARARPHTKYAVRARWAARAPCSSSTGPLPLLATASWDGSAALLRVVKAGEKEEEQRHDDNGSSSEPPLEQLPPAGCEGGKLPFRIDLVSRARFAGACLDVAFVRRTAAGPSSSSSPSPDDATNLLLIAAVRGSSHLAAIDARTGLPADWLSSGKGIPLAYAPPGSGGGAAKRQQQQQQHERVPFSAVRLSASPCGTRLLAATDGGRVLVLRQRRRQPTGGRRKGEEEAQEQEQEEQKRDGAAWGHLPPLFGVGGGGDVFHVPSLAWHGSGAHAYVATAAAGGGGAGAAGGGSRAAAAVAEREAAGAERPVAAAAAGATTGAATTSGGGGGGEVLVFDVCAGRVVARLPAHSPMAARDLDYCPRSNALATCAFDKTVRLFGGGGGVGGERP